MANGEFKKLNGETNYTKAARHFLGSDANASSGMRVNDWGVRLDKASLAAALLGDDGLLLAAELTAEPSAELVDLTAELPPDITGELTAEPSPELDDLAAELGRLPDGSPPASLPFSPPNTATRSDINTSTRSDISSTEGTVQHGGNARLPSGASRPERILYAERHRDRTEEAQLLEESGEENVNPPQAAGVVLFRRTSSGVEYFVVAKTKRRTKPGAWTPSKGYRKAVGLTRRAAVKTYNETEVEAAKRHLYCDTKFSDAVVEYFGSTLLNPLFVKYYLETVTHNVPFGIKRTAYFVAELVQEKPIVWKDIGETKSEKRRLAGTNGLEHDWTSLANARGSRRFGAEIICLFEQTESLIVKSALRGEGSHDAGGLAAGVAALSL